MEETAKISSGQKLAIIGVIDRQFKKNPTGLVEYDFLAAQDYLIETGEFDEYEIDIPKQFAILEELATEQSDIEIDFLKNDIDPNNNYVSDALHSGIALTEESDEREEKAYTIRIVFGSVYFRTSIAGIKKARAHYSNKYKIKLEFDDDFVNYRIVCLPDGKTHNFHLHDGRPPQKIIKYVMGCKVGERITKRRLNQEIYPEEYKSGRWVIPKDRSIKHHIFARDKELNLFFKMDTNGVTRLGDTIEGLTQAEMEKICKSFKKRSKID